MLTGPVKTQLILTYLLQNLNATLQSGHFMSIIQPFCVQFQPDFMTSGLTENFFQLTTTMNYDHLFGPLTPQLHFAWGVKPGSSVAGSGGKKFVGGVS